MNSGVPNRSEHAVLPSLDEHASAVWTTAGLVETTRPVDEVRRIEADREASVGDPAPMALFGFATGTFLVSMILTGMWPMGALMAVVPALLWFAGIGQFVGGLFALARGSTLGGTAFCSFGAGNVIVATFVWMQQNGVIPLTTDSKTMLGIGLFCLGYIALMLTIAAVRANAAYLVTLATLTVGYVLAAVPDVGGSPVVGHIGGWFLVASALCAFYAAGAVAVNSQWQREALPVGKFD